MNYSNPGGWKKRRAAKKKRLSHAPSPEARAQRKAKRLGVEVQAESHPESGTHEIQHKGKGWYDVVAPSGEAVNTQSLRMAQAKALVEELESADSPEATPAEINDDEPQGDNGVDREEEPA